MLPNEEKIKRIFPNEFIRLFSEDKMQKTRLMIGHSNTDYYNDMGFIYLKYTDQFPRILRNKYIKLSNEFFKEKI
jgi:hypothetical protein